MGPGFPGPVGLYLLAHAASKAALKVGYAIPLKYQIPLTHFILASFPPRCLQHRGFLLSFGFPPDNNKYST